jgi:hypothetical protein
MWTISSSPVELRRLLMLIGCLMLTAGLLSSCHPREERRVAPRESVVAWDAPAAAEQPRGARPPQIDSSQLRRPAELKAVSVRRLDPNMAEIAGKEFLRTAKDPIVIVVRAQVPFDPTPRTSWPVILLNGRTLKNSRMLPGEESTLVAFLPDRSLIRDTNTVAIAWVGNEEATTTKRPLTFRAADVRD